MIGMPPATLASKATARPCRRRRLEDLGAVLGQQRLVGGDDVLAGRQQIEHGLPGPVDAADQLDDDVDGRVVRAPSRRSVVSSSRGRATGRGLCRVADDDAAQHQRPAGPGRQALGLFEQQLGHAAADGAAADQGDVQGLVMGRLIHEGHEGTRIKYRGSAAG